MTNILTTSEAATVLRCASNDADMLALLPLIDAHIRDATGHDWTADSPIISEAKAVARMLLVRWHEDPGMIGAMNASTSATLGGAYSAALLNLEVIALRYKIFKGLDGAGGITLEGVKSGDTVSRLVGLIGVTGDRAADFETVITVDGQIQQVATGDLSGNYYRAYVVPLEGML